MGEHLAFEFARGFSEGIRGKGTPTLTLPRSTRGGDRRDMSEAFALAEGECGGEDPGAAVEGDVGPLGILGEEEDGVVDDFGLVAEIGVEAFSGDGGFGEMGGEELRN